MDPAQWFEVRSTLDQRIDLAQAHQMTGAEGVAGYATGSYKLSTLVIAMPLSINSYPSILRCVFFTWISIQPSLVFIAPMVNVTLSFGLMISLNGKVQWSCTGGLSGGWLDVVQ